VDTPYAWVELREQRQQADSTRFLVGTHTPGGNTGLEAALDLVLSTRFVFSKTSTQPTVETTIDAGLQKSPMITFRKLQISWGQKEHG